MSDKFELYDDEYLKRIREQSRCGFCRQFVEDKNLRFKDNKFYHEVCYVSEYGDGATE